ncbi:MAG: TlpA family protein disulfide reductase [Planctomyces sp.]
MRYETWFAALTVLLFAVGCGGNGTPATQSEADGGSATEPVAAEPAPVKVAADSETQAETPVAPAGDAVAETKSQTEADPAAEPASAAAQDETAKAGETDPGKPAAPADPLVEGLEFPNVNIQEVFAERKAALEKSPEDPEAVSRFVSLLSELSTIHSDQGSSEKAQSAMTQAEELYAKATAAKVAVPAELGAFVNYNSACILSKAGKPEEAMSRLITAVDTGMFNLEYLRGDPSLEAVRALPAFEEKMKVWEENARLAMVESAKKDLAAAEAFPLNFTVNDVTGKPVALSSMKGKVCIVDLWGTWCPPCREEIPSFIRLQDKYGPAGFQMIGLNEERGSDMEQNVAKVTAFIAKSGINYPCAMLNDEIRAMLPEIQGFPTTLFLDRSGKVRLVAVGAHPYEYLEAVVETLMAEEQTAETSAPAESTTAETPASSETAPAEAAQTETAPAETAPAEAATDAAASGETEKKE